MQHVDAIRPRIIQWFGMVLAALAITAILAGALEWHHYSSTLRFDWYPLGWRDRAQIFALIWGKSLGLMGPVLVLTGVLAWWGWRRTARWVFAVGTAGIVFWLVMDMLVQDSTGSHLSDYVHQALNPGAMQFAGDLSGWYWRAALVLAAVVVGVMALILGSGWAARRLVTRHLWLGARWSPFALAAVFALPIVAAIPGQRSFGSPGLLVQLHAQLPVDVPFAGWTTPTLRPADEFCGRVQEALSPLYRELHERLTVPQPIDEAALTLPPDPPNVVIIVLESLRYNIISQEVMPQTAAWGRQGLRLDRHFAGSNCSHPGLFALLYGRTPYLYDRSLNAKLVAQFPVAMRRAGYEAVYLASSSPVWDRMEEYLDERAFDRMTINNGEAWWRRDQRTLGQIREALDRPGKPKFVVAFLMCTHHPYYAPKGYEPFQPASDEAECFGDRTDERRALILNRYQNAARFLDDEFAPLLKSMDPRKNLVIITGDHGESFYEDGCMAHGSRLSEIQTRVPCLIVGPGVSPGLSDRPTTHADLMPTVLHLIAGRPVELKHCTGRDLLAPPPPPPPPPPDTAPPPELALPPELFADRPDSATRPALSPASNHAVVSDRPCMGWPWQDVLIVRPENKMRVRLWLRDPRIEVRGFENEKGQIDPRLTPPLDQVPLWTDAAAQALRRLAK